MLQISPGKKKRDCSGTRLWWKRWCSRFRARFFPWPSLIRSTRATKFRRFGKPSLIERTLRFLFFFLPSSHLPRCAATANLIKTWKQLHRFMTLSIRTYQWFLPPSTVNPPPCRRSLFPADLFLKFFNLLVGRTVAEFKLDEIHNEMIRLFRRKPRDNFKFDEKFNFSLRHRSVTSRSIFHFCSESKDK